MSQGEHSFCGIFYFPPQTPPANAANIPSAMLIKVYAMNVP